MNEDCLREKVEKYSVLKSQGKLSEEREGALATFNEVMDLLEEGRLRTASRRDEEWEVNLWVKQGIMLGFPLGNVTTYNGSADISFVDKETFPLRRITPEMGIRVVPPSVGLRRGSFAGKGTVFMPPAYVNVGAYVGDGTMVENLAGSCCQIGKDSHISAGAVIGGVLDPIEATPVILGDNVLLGEGSGVTQGSRLGDLVTLTPGVHISKGTPVIDPIRGIAYPNKGMITLERTRIGGINFYTLDKVIDEKDPSYGPEVPRGALVISGVMLSSTGTLKTVPMVTKYIEDKSQRAYALEEALRS
ncbi:hypothetical protein HYT57_03030 [Candidatus Woesearchaeota archaeon]|nr:hypothetical protein [Candidatus Woesearchaeota archaeon]